MLYCVIVMSYSAQQLLSQYAGPTAADQGCLRDRVMLDWAAVLNVFRKPPVLRGTGLSDVSRTECHICVGGK